MKLKDSNPDLFHAIDSRPAPPGVSERLLSLDPWTGRGGGGGAGAGVG